MKNYIVQKIRHYCNISVDNCSAIDKERIDFYDLTFVCSGSMTYIADGKKITLKRNDALFLRPGTERIRLQGTEPVKYVSFNFDIYPDVELPFESYMPNCISAEIRNLAATFPQSHLLPYYHSKEKAVNMLNYILFELLDIVSLGTNNGYVIKIAKYVDEHMNEKISLRDVSAYTDLSREYTAAIFKREMGKTLTDFINERKMLVAKELILSSGMGLCDIAAHLGYENYNYFSRLFKRYFDNTPIRVKQTGDPHRDFVGWEMLKNKMPPF
ncbi:MAG: AraC family transcriptional regulator [Ruminococcaceae bacterium]|nr:AraC family transcriptional regulator [Oscillospiraceae bacterium]